MKRPGLLIAIGLLALSSASVFAKFEAEQLQIESQLQARIESILSKTLEPNSYIVTVKVEMEDVERTTSRAQTARRTTGGNLLGQNQYVLPGVPGKKEFATAQQTENSSNLSTFSAETLVKRITIAVLVSNDVSADQIRGIREVITGSVPFNPLRGDEMQIQNSNLLKSTKPAPGLDGLGVAPAERSFFSSIVNRANAPVLMIAGALITIFVLFFAFLFGPIRAFMNRLLTVLPRVGEQAAYTVSNAPNKTKDALAAQNGFGMNGNGSHDDKEAGARPFRFVREDQLSKLPILCRSLTPVQCALILAYLPAAWASKVLGVLEPATQTAIMRELSQAHEIPPETIKDLEELVKAKLPYLVGGEDWIQSVYQLTQPQTQRTLLGTLNQQSPELAQALRRKTFFMEDLSSISAGGVRLIVQETGYPMVALAVRDEKPEFRDALLQRLPVAMREILQQEYELAADDKAGIADAKTKLLETGRRLLVEGRLTLQERK